MRRFAYLTLLLLAGSSALWTQSCPGDPDYRSDSLSTLHGIIVYHEDLRQWLELQLQTEICGGTSIQLVPEEGQWRDVESLRDCKVTVTGNLFEPSTGYYSAAMAIDHIKITRDSACKPHPIKPDLTKVLISPVIKRYFVRITIDYSGGGHIAVEAWNQDAKKRRLDPWDLYARYSLTGSRYVIWFHCGKGFEISSASQVPRQDHEIFQDDPMMWGTTLNENVVNRITYTCTRSGVR